MTAAQARKTLLDSTKQFQNDQMVTVPVGTIRAALAKDDSEVNTATKSRKQK